MLFPNNGPTGLYRVPVKPIRFSTRARVVTDIIPFVFVTYSTLRTESKINHIFLHSSNRVFFNVFESLSGERRPVFVSYFVQRQ